MCFISYFELFIHVCECSGSITLVGKRELIFLLSFSCNYVDSVRRGLFFLLVLGMGCVILLWHSLGLPYPGSVYLFCVRFPLNLIIIG